MYKIKGQKNSTQQQKNLLDQRNSALTQEITLLEQQIDITTRSIAANEALEERQTELFHKQVRMEEEQGTLSYWSVLFKATSFADLISRIDFINEIARYNKKVIADLQVETDAPYCEIRSSSAAFGLVETKFEGRVKKEKMKKGLMCRDRNEPCAIIQVLESVAKIKNISKEELAKICYDNTNKFFNLK